MMNKRKLRFTLSPEQMKVLREATESSEEMLDGVAIYDLMIEGTENRIELIREHLTTLLAKTGFDDDYELTEKGLLIEGLIDLLHLSP